MLAHQTRAPIIPATPHTHLGALGLVLKEGVDLGHCAVEGSDDEALVVHVEDQVLALQTRKRNGARGRERGVNNTSHLVCTGLGQLGPRQGFCSTSGNASYGGGAKGTASVGKSAEVSVLLHTITARPISARSELLVR